MSEEPFFSLVGFCDGFADVGCRRYLCVALLRVLKNFPRVRISYSEIAKFRYQAI